MAGFSGALLVVVLAGMAPGGAKNRLPSADSVCVRTTHYFPDIHQSVHCYSSAEFVRWQQAGREARIKQRLRQRGSEVARAHRRCLERREWDERLREARDERRRQNARLMEERAERH